MNMTKDIRLVRRLLGSCVLIGILGALPACVEALEWEWYVGAFVGGAFPMSDDLKVDQIDTLTSSSFTSTVTETTTARGATFDASPVVGTKAGVCPGFFPYLCAELEFDYLSPTLGSQTTAGKTQTVFDFGTFTSNFAQIPQINFDVWELGVNFIGRLAFVPESSYPLGGRLHLYLGAGPSIVWTRAKDPCCGGSSNTDVSVGVQALGGVKFFITKNLAIFGEYKFKHWTSDFSFSTNVSQTLGAERITERVQTRVTDVDFNVQMFSIGLAFHF